MKKIVVFEFPDDFNFPEYFGQRNATRKEKDIGVHTGTVYSTKNLMTSTCFDCPFYTSDCDGAWCMITGGEKGHHEKCPFYGGADTVNYNDY